MIDPPTSSWPSPAARNRTAMRAAPCGRCCCPMRLDCRPAGDTAAVRARSCRCRERESCGARVGRKACTMVAAAHMRRRAQPSWLADGVARISDVLRGSDPCDVLNPAKCMGGLVSQPRASCGMYGTKGGQGPRTAPLAFSNDAGGLRASTLTSNSAAQGYLSDAY